MSYQSCFLRRLANVECERIARKAIRYLQSLNHIHLLGDDSGLENVWEEICVQEQGQYTWAWPAYEMEIERSVHYDVEHLSALKQELIWIQTPESDEWDGDAEDAALTAPVYLGDITRHIVNAHVRRMAREYKNRRTCQYLERLSGYDL
jgi:hypothetical protein